MNQRIASSSIQASKATELVELLQHRFVKGLEKQGGVDFVKTEWLRDGGLHGGGTRYSIADSQLLGRASVNVSHVQYDNDPNKKLGSATALSTIVHPKHPLAPSVHIHISWTELKNGVGYWRMMADLNPAVPHPVQTSQFASALEKAAPNHYKEAEEQGDRYFFIPALARHRGTTHFYLENFSSDDFEQDLIFARKVGLAAIDTYIDLLAGVLGEAAEPSEDERAVQLAYHTLYFFQVLTLDRGTTSGLLVHDQNDVGILGSLPASIDKNLLASWRSRMTPPQDKLLDRMLNALPRVGICTLDPDAKGKLAEAVRAHYQMYPEALDLQASGNSTPPTVANHQ
jgi:coproporphyrinogen III oxidase